MVHISHCENFQNSEASPSHSLHKGSSCSIDDGNYYILMLHSGS